MPVAMEQEELKRLLTRAEQIQEQSRIDVELDAELRQIVQAAEEAGLDREAVLQAVQERISLRRPVSVGDFVFAASADGKKYPAKVVSVDSYSVTVKFLNGGDQTLAPDDVQRLSVAPGLKVEAPWPNFGWWTCTVVSYDPELMKVKLSDGWGSEHTFHLSDLRLKGAPTKWELQTFSLAHLIGATLGGSILGFVLSKILTR